MADTAYRHSPLEHAADRFAAATRATRGAVRLAELPFLTQLDLRLDPEGPAAGAAEAALGLTLPRTPDTLTRVGDLTALWLGPDEWLIVAAAGQRPALEQRLRAALAGHFAALTDVSAQRTTLLVGGPRARDLLAHGCALDLHPRAFRGCAQTLLARTQVTLVARHPHKPGFWVLVRSSFAGYLADWLLDAAGEYVAPQVGGGVG